MMKLEDTLFKVQDCSCACLGLKDLPALRALYERCTDFIELIR